MIRLGVTLGDPAGIGPEITVAALRALPSERLRQLVVYGDRGPLERAAAALGVAVPSVEVRGSGEGEQVQPGQPSERSGAASVAYLEAALAAVRAGDLQGLVTAPISKTWARRSGFEFPGHTELLAARLGAPHVAMMFAGERLRVVLATIHVPLAQVPGLLTVASLTATLNLFAVALRRDFGLRAPRIGVVGLNPHAGEGGLLGAEELEVIGPVVAAGAEGAVVTGPLVPDAAFREAALGAYDGLVAMYHDQGLIPIKLLEFEDAVNVTLGLPIVRTSPDHGTAFDIAGKALARATSMQRALELGLATAERRASAGHNASLGQDRG